MSRQRVFSRIYRGNLWHGAESLSGPGSGFAPTRPAAFLLRRLVDGYGVRSVLDVGCGDSVWLPDLPGYVGIDVAPEAVRRARRFHPDRAYEVWDAVESLPPGSWDMVLVRDVIQHLPMADGVRLLANVRRAGVRLLVASHYTGTSKANPRDLANTDIRAGACYSPVLTDPPFSMPRPDDMVADGWDYQTGETVRDGAKWLGIWVLRDPTEPHHPAGLPVAPEPASSDITQPHSATPRIDARYRQQPQDPADV